MDILFGWEFYITENEKNVVKSKKTYEIIRQTNLLNKITKNLRKYRKTHMDLF